MNTQQQQGIVVVVVVVVVVVLCILGYIFIVKPWLQTRSQSDVPTSSTVVTVPPTAKSVVIPVVPPPPLTPVVNAPIGKTLSLERQSGTDYINIGTLAAFYQGTKYNVVSGGTTPLYDVTRPWTMVNDDNAATMTVASNRSEERRVGKECRIGCRSRWSPYH